MAELSPSHLVLARKWRPERFSELVGQEHVTRTLSEALKRGRIAHAFLFTGIRGVGKTTAARILARCLNCEKGPTPEPCGECTACVEIRAGRALDVSEIDGATYRKIDDARAIIENLSYRPARDRFKIYIIDEAHQLTDQAFNALLKTLEEPPAHVKFILATTEPQKMPETILSRLQRYDFRRIPFATIFERLSELASREETPAEDAALRLLAREAGGSMRDAERMLETAIASATEAKVTEAEVASSLGVASRTTVFKIIEAILDHSAAPALRMVRELASRGANLESLGRDLLETLRNLAVAKLPADGGQSPLDDLPDLEAQELKRIAANASSRDLMRLFRLMADAQEEIIRSPYPDLLIEMAVVRMASLAPVMDADELLRAIGASGGASGPPSRGPASTPSSSGGGARASSAEPPPAPSARRLPVKGEVKADAPLRQPAPVPAPSSGPAAPAGSDLPAFRDHIRSRRAALAGFMEQGATLWIDGDTLAVFPRNDIYVRYLADNRAVVAELASEFFGRPIKVELAAPDATPPPEPTSAPSGSSADANLSAAAPPTNGRAPNGAPARTAASSADERAEIYSDPGMRRIFDAFEARLVEVRPARGGKEQE
jgi:DNA polymerase-3 subunit gamma/tau